MRIPLRSCTVQLCHSRPIQPLDLPNQRERIRFYMLREDLVKEAMKLWIDGQGRSRIDRLPLMCRMKACCLSGIQKRTRWKEKEELSAEKQSAVHIWWSVQETEVCCRCSQVRWNCRREIYGATVSSARVWGIHQLGLRCRTRQLLWLLHRWVFADVILCLPIVYVELVGDLSRRITWRTPRLRRSFPLLIKNQAKTNIAFESLRAVFQRSALWNMKQCHSRFMISIVCSLHNPLNCEVWGVSIKNSSILFFNNPKYIAGHVEKSVEWLDVKLPPTSLANSQVWYPSPFFDQSHAKSEIRLLISQDSICGGRIANLGFNYAHDLKPSNSIQPWNLWTPLSLENIWICQLILVFAWFWQRRCDARVDQPRKDWAQHLLHNPGHLADGGCLDQWSLLIGSISVAVAKSHPRVWCTPSPSIAKSWIDVGVFEVAPWFKSVIELLVMNFLLQLMLQNELYMVKDIHSKRVLCTQPYVNRSVQKIVSYSQTPCTTLCTWWLSHNSHLMTIPCIFVQQLSLSLEEC